MVPLLQSFSPFSGCEWEEMGTINHIFTRAVISGLEVNKDSQAQSKMLDHFHRIGCNLLGRMTCGSVSSGYLGESQNTPCKPSAPSFKMMVLWFFCPIAVIFHGHNHVHQTSTLLYVSQFLMMFYYTLRNKDDVPRSLYTLNEVAMARCGWRFHMCTS